MRAANEPVHVACGIPDFVVGRISLPIGHIENKAIGSGLDRVKSDSRLKRYRAGLQNLIHADYKEFRWYAYGELREMARIGRIDSPGGAKRRGQSGLTHAPLVRQQGDDVMGALGVKSTGLDLIFCSIATPKPERIAASDKGGHVNFPALARIRPGTATRGLHGSRARTPVRGPFLREPCV